MVAGGLGKVIESASTDGYTQGFDRLQFSSQVIPLQGLSLSSMADLFQDGINLFNSGHYFEAHEVWEDLWRESSGPLRLYYQGLIHAAAGLHHLRKGNHGGARSQLVKSVTKLEQYPEIYCGINKGRLVSDLQKLLRNLTPGVVLIERI